MPDIKIKKPVALVSGDIYLQHQTGSHPENPRRLAAISPVVSKLLTEKPGQFSRLDPVEISLRRLEEVHDPGYVKALQEFCEKGGHQVELDTFVSKKSFQAALCAVGGLVRGIDAVLEGEAASAFALVRPPGHHALNYRAMGFCLFNSVAVAARYLTREKGLKRVLVLDWDVHHGNGTQEAFYEDPAVLFYSSHQSPLYPGTGALEETGRGKGRGFTINLPLPAPSGDAIMERAFTELLEPLVARFKPEFILVSAGFDAHWKDALPGTGLSVTTRGFARLAERARILAETYCEGRLALTLEGGYNPQALAASVEATLRVLTGETPEEAARHDWSGPQSSLPANHFYIDKLMKEARELHSLQLF